MKILLLTAHSIAEYDDLRMLHDLGHQVLSIGAYIDPAHPDDDKRPALPEVPSAPIELTAQLADQMAAKSNLPSDAIDWADTIIIHHFPTEAPDGQPGWISGNWTRMRHKRVIWRTCGQSNHVIEARLAPYRGEGLQIVRYSPNERALPYYAGEDALIRFGKYPADWHGWTGEQPVVGNVSQQLIQRGAATNGAFWMRATDGLDTLPAGPGSEVIGGLGELTYEDMCAYLRRIRCYLYTGTQPASYTLGLIEAMMTGVPVISIGPAWMRSLSYGSELFEGADIAGAGFDDPKEANDLLAHLISSEGRGLADRHGAAQRQRAVEMFGIDTIREQWRAFLA